MATPKTSKSHADVRIDQKESVVPENIQSWLDEIYDPLLIDDAKLESMYDLLKYDGFDRMEVLRLLKRIVTTKELVVEVVLACALRGPVRASLTKLSNGQTILQMGIKASGLKGTKGISCARITAATADLAAFYLKRLKVPKRVNVDCPGWLQFPAAGAIKLPDDLRKLHIEFSQRFSVLIGGVFNEQIYGQMIQNAYYNDKLKLF